MNNAREQLHTIAEWLLAGPQFAASATIRLTVSDGRISTVADPLVQVDGDGLVHDGVRVGLRGTVAEIGRRAGLTAVRPHVDYHDPVPGGPETTITASPEDFDAVIAAFTTGKRALALVTDVEPVLWPEHFDLAVRVDEVNLGVSPGDTFSAAAYAYVGPATLDHDPFWNAPFGAYRVITPHDDASAVATFLQSGLQRAAR